MKAPLPAQESATQSELTPRQRQILSLLQAGKVNKEIARELGIGLGTVKQHVVALFKKLNVSNRTMAVSAGTAKLHAVGNVGPATLTVDALLEQRPCVVLSTALPDEAEVSLVRRLHGTLAALAFDHDALFLARKGNAGDVIFGIQRVTEYDLLKALRTAHAAYMDLSSLDLVLAGKLSGGLTAGLAVASMKRFGGWSGEAIASSAIYFARELVQEAGVGRLAFGQSAQDLMLSFGIGNGETVPSVFFHELDTLRWTGERFIFPFVDRSTELEKLKSALKEVESGLGRLMYLEGETGMGKSRLCREIVESSLRNGGSASLFRCQPLGSGEVLNNVLEGGAVCLPENVAELLRAPPLLVPEVIIIDDFHLLAKEKQSLLFTEAQAGMAGRLVVFSGRSYDSNKVEQPNVEVIRLGRLPVEAIEKLVRLVVREGGAKLRSGKVKAISRLSAGVPLFAVELARHGDSNMIELPLLVIICGRLEGFPLDRKLLRIVARFQGNPTVMEIASELGEEVASVQPAVDRARAYGVLLRDQDNDERISFSHPIISQAINQISME